MSSKDARAPAPAAAGPGLTLRQQAEAQVRDSATGDLSPEETRQTVHELRVHQIELEMQNEELRRAQLELDAARARYFDLYDLAPVGYFTVSDNGLILEANLTVSTMLGVPRGALVKEPVSRFIFKDDADAYYLLRKEVLKNDGKQSRELRMVMKSGMVFWVRLEVVAARDVHGAALLRIALSDISERKRAEDEAARLDAQLQQVHKMESVGRLAGGVAHDFNNMLTVILANVSMAMDQVDPATPLHGDLAEIREAATRSANLTRQLLVFARKHTIAPKVLDLNVAIAGTLQMLGQLIGDDIRLDSRPGAGLWPVRVDSSQVDQVLANLCVNARDAIAGVGNISIETGNRTFDGAACRALPGALPGDYVTLTVRDDGCGMDKETLSHVFEPFFTTKATGEGTGLGLATVWGVVHQNQGFIHATSAPGRGSTLGADPDLHGRGSSGVS